MLSVRSWRTIRQRPPPIASADGDLTTTGGRARQQQVGHVHATDQEHERHRCYQHVQRRAEITEHHLAIRPHAHSSPFHVSRLALGDPARHAFHVGLRGVVGDVRLQLAHHAERMAPVVRALLRREHERRPELGRERRHVVLGCRDADHGVCFAIEPHRPADDRLVARESPSPEAMTEYDDTDVGRHIGIGEVPSEHGCHVHDAEVAGRDAHTPHTLGLAVRQVVGCAGHGRRMFEDTPLVGPIMEVADRGISRTELTPGFVHEDDAVAVVGGERTQEHRVQHTKDGDGRADAERNRHNEHSRQHRAHRQLTNGEPEIVAPVGPPLRSAHGMLPLFCKCSADSLDVLDIAEAAQRFVTCGRRRQALRAELLDAHLEMERELVVHVGCRVGTPEAQIPAPERSACPERAWRVEWAHDTGCCLALRTRATACAKPDQMSAFLSSCLRPSAVRR